MLKNFNLVSYKILIYLIVILKYPITKNDQEIAAILELVQRDLEFCPECFQWQMNCSILKDIDFTDDFVGALNNLFGVKHTRYGKLGHDSSKIVIKYLASEEKFRYIGGGLSEIYDEEEKSKKLQQLFFDKSRIDGYNFCPPESIDYFLNKIAPNQSALVTWFYLNINPLPLLLKQLNIHNFPVPKFYGSCGFIIFESYDGQPLINYYSRPFVEKLKIAEQLLEAAFKFTEGIDGYKLYLTDANPDNIVFDEQAGKISVVDLDNIIIVDSLMDTRKDSLIPNSEWHQIHKHEIIECNGCFAYVPSEICAHHDSDLNLFTICQLLREDLYGDRAKGFIFPVPNSVEEKYPDFSKLLDICVNCNERDCNRFEIAYRLLNIIRTILYFYISIGN